MTSSDARRRFCIVVSRWRLTQAEVRSILGVPEGHDGMGICPGLLDRRASRRMAAMVELDDALCDALGIDRTVAWLRRPSRSLDGVTPIEAMVDPVVLRALVQVALGPSAARMLDEDEG